MADIEENVYTRRTTVQITPPDQEDEIVRQRSAVLDQYSVIKEAITALDEDADFYESSLYSVSEEALTKEPEQFVREVIANKKAAASLRAAARKLEELVEEHAKRR